MSTSTAATGPPIGFDRVTERKTVENRLHLDLITADFTAETARLLALGATVVTTVEA